MTGASRAERVIKGSALDNPMPKGKERVMRVREELWKRVGWTLEQVEETAKQGVNAFADIRREASFARTDMRNTYWGSYGPNQGNAGRHIDALAGIVYGYMEAIALLDEVLGDSSINERRNLKHGKDQGQEQRKEGSEVEGEATVEAEGQGSETSAVEREVERAKASIKSARAAKRSDRPARVRAGGATSKRASTDRSSRKPHDGKGARS